MAQLQQGQGQGREEGVARCPGFTVAARFGDGTRRCDVFFSFSLFFNPLFSKRKKTKLTSTSFIFSTLFLPPPHPPHIPSPPPPPPHTHKKKTGAVFGDLPPYEAFSLGGTNSVRGYGEGSLGTGRAYAEATAELLFPLPVGGGALEGCLFADVGSDLDTGSAVPGDPASARGKPGSGAGVGVGVRIDSPVGPLRLECALSDRLQRRFHLGIGSHG